MLEILGGTSDGDLLEVVINLHSSIPMFTIPQKLTLIFSVNIIYIPQKKEQINVHVKIYTRNE